MKLFDFLATDIQFVKGVGPSRAKALRKAGVKTLEDMLYFLPKDYEDRRNIKKIAQLKPGKRAVFIGEVWTKQVVEKRTSIFEVIFRDETGVVKAKWFHFKKHAFERRFKEGKKFLVVGDVRYNRYERCLEVVHPETRDYELVDLNEFRRVVPVYPFVEGLGQKTIEKIVANCINEVDKVYEEYIPSKVLNNLGLVSLPDAFRILHFAEDDLEKLKERKSRGHFRLIFEEFFIIQVALALKKVGVKQQKGISFNVKSEKLCAFLENLPFELTNAQKRVLKEILQDMASDKPMNRLLQGDVGSGKTVVAVAAAVVAVDNGYQVAVMAPTEILAEQHYRNIREMVKGLGIQVGLLTSSTPKGEREVVLRRVANGDLDILVGTHALIQEGVNFKKLGFAIIDEQHRFGVLQRKLLREKGKNCDLLVMTATPIPRTLALTVYGDLDVSVIDEMPKGRQPIITRVITPKDREKAYAFIEKQLEKGRQAYIVFPLIEESEKLQLPSVLEMYPVIAQRFSKFKVGLLHGRMSGQEKEEVMRRFKEGEIQVLVSTTVIEVGIDVPNATVMLIEGAERFGLSQLHQLRGRVGRGEHKSYCLLMMSGERANANSYMRLKVLEETADGFKIAEADLKFRGPGELLGVRQSGLPDFRVADLLKDRDILEEAKKQAEEIVNDDPLLMKPENRLLRQVLEVKGVLKKLAFTEAG
ncbi:ATP-dependent DNA helicase RecG [Thermosulfidibacter takaii ABI70S6]|uniref:ATP-dependent DNA helicase RecG n=1 Tax=Thermosulfidibacter takaii (strain DSM 17441 / JCM 13301 / NBRC 103674 / ABI70S6) TaxID=1298851 RepID=A0A0S3QSK4_THET7|nr:ATP-dependent DNA helicase RecG [Thermosulfidibacter takaii]BAT71306.1 ATP-dependent DNA helicase RecG [Thermosulfidibacter takaii ABI70S6]